MSYAPLNTKQAFLAPNLDIPKPDSNPEIFYQVINDRERETGTVVNQKEHGIYSTEEITNCQQWPGATPQDQRQGFRKLILLSVPLVAGANNFAHGLTIAGFTFTRIYGTVQNAGPVLVAAIPQGDPGGGTNTGVSVEVNAVNVVVTINAASPYIGFTGQVILEYLKN